MTHTKLFGDSLVGLSPSWPRGSGGRSLLLTHIKQLLEDLAILVVDDGCHLKLPLQGLNLGLEGTGGDAPSPAISSSS